MERTKYHRVSIVINKPIEAYGYTKSDYTQLLIAI